MAQQGFATWNPTGASREMYEDIMRVLREYEDYLPMTGRQVFYRLVGAFGYDKSEATANRVYNVLGRARRCGWIPFDVIRDGGSTAKRPRTWDDANDFWHDVRDDFDHYRRDRQAGQPAYIELFCEAPGMIDQLVRVGFPFSIPVYGTRGYTGLGVIHQIAKRALMRDRPTTLLQVGDYDPSGVGIFESMVGDAGAFVRQVTTCYRQKTDDGEAGPALAEALGLDEERIAALGELDHDDLPALTAHRVALNAAQVEQYDLPTAPASSKDSRAKNWTGETCQLEAMPPDRLAAVVKAAIMNRIDVPRYQQEVDAEEADRESIAGRMPPEDEDE